MNIVDFILTAIILVAAVWLLYKSMTNKRKTCSGCTACVCKKEH